MHYIEIENIKISEVRYNSYSKIPQNSTQNNMEDDNHLSISNSLAKTPVATAQTLPEKQHAKEDTSERYRVCSHNQQCRWYLEIKRNKYTIENLQHMDEYRHEKCRCRYGRECRAFNRLAGNGYRWDDIGHCSIYFHSGRRAGTTIEENFDSKKFMTAYQNWGVDLPKGYGFWNGVVKDGELIKELENNGYGKVMTVASNLYKTMNDVAREKLSHPRHRKMGSPLSHDQMLAILLYTGTNVYADMRQDEMKYSKHNFADVDPSHIEKPRWPLLSSLLTSALWLLDKFDDTPRPTTVYHGLHSIEVDPSVFNNYGEAKLYSENCKPVFRYGTFISTSWDETVAKSFICNKGSLLVIDLNTPSGTEPLIGADVSWISKFPSECEFLIARSATFVIQSIDLAETGDYQIVKVKEGPISHNRTKFEIKYGS